MLSKRYDAALDVIRIIACFLVIVEHTILQAGGRLSYLIYVFSKALVYLFFIISGMVLFKRSYSYREIGKKVAKTMLTIVLVSFYYLYFIENVPFDFIDYVRRIINYPVSIYLWYLYVMIIVYLSLPLLYKLVNQMEKKDFHYYFLICFGIYIVMTLLQDLNIVPVFGYLVPGIFVDIYGLLMIGVYESRYQLTNQLGIRKLGFGFVVSYLVCYVGSILGFGYNGEVLLYGIIMFMFLKCLIDRVRVEDLQRWIQRIAILTYGVYLFHVPIFEHLKELGLVAKSVPLILLLDVGVFVGCLLLCKLLSYVPVAGWCLQTRRK